MEDPVYRALRTARSCLDRLERDHATVRANMAAGQQPTLSQGVATADPDGNVTWTRVEADGNTRIHLGIGRYQQLIMYATANMLQAEKLIEYAAAGLLEADLMRGLNVTANTAPLASRDRCTGGAGDWADPACERLSVVDRWVDGVQHQLCYGCDKRRQRAAVVSS